MVYDDHLLLQLVNATVEDVSIKEGVAYDCVLGVLERRISAGVDWGQFLSRRATPRTAYPRCSALNTSGRLLRGRTATKRRVEGDGLCDQEVATTAQPETFCARQASVSVGSLNTWVAPEFPSPTT